MGFLLQPKQEYMFSISMEIRGWRPGIPQLRTGKYTILDRLMDTIESPSALDTGSTFCISMEELLQVEDFCLKEEDETIADRHTDDSQPDSIGIIEKVLIEC